MKRTLMAVLVMVAGTAFVYGSAQAMTRKGVGKLTATNLSAHVVVETDAVPHATGAAPSTLQATYTITNPTNETITYPQRGSAVNWKIVDRHGTVVYDADFGKIMPHVIALRILMANEHQDYMSTVSLQNQKGAPLPRGHYVLRACLTGVDNLTTTKSFTIK